MWCNVINMWTDDMDDEDRDMCGCDGECRGCDEASISD